VPDLEIPFNDLSRHEPDVAGRVRSAVNRVVDSGRYVLGPEVEGFETEFAAYCQRRHCVALGNGTDALELALRAVGVGAGTRVGTVANAGMYTTAATLAIGATPVYIDVDSADHNLSLELLRDDTFASLGALVITHLYGRMANMPAICERAKRHGVPIIEDCAQAHGANLGGRPAGSWGAAGCFSFYPTKNLGALGDAGAVVSSDGEIAEKVRLLREYGWSRRGVTALGGGRNSRMDEIQAAVLRVKLAELDRWTGQRRAIRRVYDAALGATSLGRPAPPDDSESDVTHLYVVASENRSALVSRLAAAGISTQVHFPIPDHKQVAASGRFAIGTALNNTEWLGERVLSLPCFLAMTEEEIGHVAAALASES